MGMLKDRAEAVVAEAEGLEAAAAAVEAKCE